MVDNKNTGRSTCTNTFFTVFGNIQVEFAVKYKINIFVTEINDEQLLKNRLFQEYRI